MYIEIDFASVPPSVVLREPDDFKSFKVVAERAEHAYVGVDALRNLAGAVASDPDWSANLGKMLTYAESKGWVREDGAIRAHVEWK